MPVGGFFLYYWNTAKALLGTEKAGNVLLKRLL
jgi:hypothetical protein